MSRSAAAVAGALVSVVLALAATTTGTACDQDPDVPPDAAPVSTTTPDPCIGVADPPSWCDAGTLSAPGCAFGHADGLCLAQGPVRDSCTCSDCADAGACNGVCVDDGQCGDGNDGGTEDCTCIDCFGTAACTPAPIGCVDDGVCDPDHDDCVCADCAEDVRCRECHTDGNCAERIEGCACHDCLASPRCAKDGG